MKRDLSQSLKLGVLFIALVAFAAACTHQKTVQVGSHKVTVSRHGFEKKLHVAKDSGVSTFNYEGVSTAGDKLKVTIEGDRVTVNGRDFGRLREGDSVFVGDDGVAVNSMDYGESEKYLRANNSSPDSTRVN